ncbi:MAG: AAA family ATPase [Pseudonocardiaceae bacterium]
MLAVKQAADLDPARGQLLLTGSANHLADRTISETLAGRAGRLTLWPLSLGERLWAVPVSALWRSDPLPG